MKDKKKLTAAIISAVIAYIQTEQPAAKAPGKK
jgi:hypothetical protein